MAGLVYGWPALRQQIINDGTDLTENKLGAVFTVGAWSTQGGRFVTGLARDRWGTRLAACACLLCAATGSFGIALSDASNGAALGASLFFVGIGSGVQLCVQPVAELFPKYSGAVLSSLSGAFQISGLMFLVLANVSNSRRGSFLGFYVCLLGLTVVAALLLPAGRSFLIKNESPSSADQIVAGAEEQSSVVEEVSTATAQEKSKRNVVAPTEGVTYSHSDSEKEETHEEKSSVAQEVMEEAEAQPSAFQQIRSWEYAGLIVWFSVCIIPLQYYIGTIGFQLEENGDDGFYTNLFSITYAAAAMVAPFGGYLADKWSLGIAHALATVLTATSLFVLASPASLDVQVIGLVCYGVGRMLTFGIYFSNVGKRFGYANYGTLAGLGLIISAIVSLLQYPLIALAADGHAVPVNVFCGAILMAVTPYCVWLHCQEGQYDKAQLKKGNQKVSII